MDVALSGGKLRAVQGCAEGVMVTAAKGDRSQEKMFDDIVWDPSASIPDELQNYRYFCQNILFLK